jgi:hypothetical protein
LRSSILIIESSAQKQMIESSFGRKFHDLNYFEVGVFFHNPWIHHLLEGIITQLCGRPSIEYIFNYTSNKLETIICPIPPTRTPLVASSKICRLFLKYFFCDHNLVGFVDQYVLKNTMSFFLCKIQSYCIVLNHFHLTLGKDEELSTLPCLHS